MTISFDGIPGSWRVPGAYIEIDNSRALKGLTQFEKRILMFGQRLSSGTVPKLQLTPVYSAEQGAAYYGRGSMLADMIRALKRNGQEIRLYVVALDDDPDGVAASGSIVVSGTASENGTIFLYVGGKLVQVGVKAGDSANAIAAAINSAINANPNLPVTSTVNTATVTVTYRHKGTVGNQLSMQLNYYGREAGERTPAGITITINQISGGATDPNIQDALDVVPDEIFDFIVTPYTDSSNLSALEAELESRWGPMRMLEGHVFTSKIGTVGELSTFGNGRNSPHVTCFGVYDVPNPPYEFAAAAVGKISLRTAEDPARPHNDLSIASILPPPELSRFTMQERNGLLYDGISTYTVDRAGKVWLERVITMYQTSNADTPDPSYLDYTTMATLAYLRQDSRAFLNTTFRGFKIVDDGTRISPGQKTTTPSGIRAALIGRALLWQEAGLIENVDDFEKYLIVERNASDPTRVDYLMAPDLQNPLFMFAGQIQFVL